MLEDDLLLIELTKKGDRQAFDALVRKYERRAYQYAFRLTSSADEAGDIVADAFVRVNSAIANFKGHSAFGTWLYRILTNCYLDLRKRERIRRHESLESSMNLEGEEVQRQIKDESDGPAEIAERNVRESLVREAMANMPEYQQAMLVMYHVEDLSYEQISEALDLPIGTVKSRLNRARLALRDLLAANTELFRMT